MPINRGSALLSVCVEPHMKQALCAEAERRGITLSELVRRRLDAEQELVDTLKPIRAEIRTRLLNM